MMTALVAMTITLLAAVGYTVELLDHQLRDRAVRQEHATAAAVLALTVERNTDGQMLISQTPDVTTRADMDSDVALLKSRGDLLGLSVWSTTGHLLYADPTTTTAPELSATILGQVVSGKDVVHHVSDAGSSRVAVYLGADADHDGRTDAVVAVTLPQVPDHSTRDLLALYSLAGLGIVLAVAAVVGLYRRMVSRDRESRRDQLTGLGNRRAFADAVAHQHARRSGDAARYAALLLDLDRFKEVNDNLGHAAGDALLIQVAKALVAAVRPTDTVARLGGDEFAVLLADVDDPDRAVTIAESVREALTARGFAHNGVAVDVDSSIGVALCPAHATDPEQLLARADVAMYEAKRQGLGVVLYDPERDETDTARLTLLAELRTGIASGQLRLVYQPKQRLADQTITGVEALVRWQHPDHGLLLPAAFLPAAEHTSLIHALTEWVLDEAIRQAASWARDGMHLRISVNISPRTLNPKLPDLLIRLLMTHGLGPQAIELEITETAVAADPDTAADVLRRLSTMGVTISLDDFGAGYTSLAYMTRLALHTLKIDQQFVTTMLEDRHGETVAAAVIDLGHRLGLNVVAEGVEAADVETHLTRLGCDEIQGYLLTVPLPPAALRDWLEEHGHVPSETSNPPLMPAADTSRAGRR
jgi:diguanylate cyclase (GGDEF)-like protein